MNYIETTKSPLEIQRATTRKHFDSLDQASSYVISRLEKRRKRIINWSDYITCVSNVETGYNLYIVGV